MQSREDYAQAPERTTPIVQIGRFGHKTRTIRVVRSTMNHRDNVSAFGAPGNEPRWTRSAKEGIGTAYHTSCRVWFTLSHGIVNELYYPNVDCPNTRDLQLLITDGETFCHEEKRDLDHRIEYPERHLSRTACGGGRGSRARGLR